MTRSDLERTMASGLVVLTPLLVSLFALLWIYQRLAGVPLPIEPPLSVLLALVMFVLVVFSLGYLMRTTIGEIAERILDDLVNMVPGLRVVYNASKIAVETAVSGTEDLKTPVKLEPWEGRRMTAFKTGKSTADGRDVLFLPTAPNITTGFVIEVDPERYADMDESVEDALTRILSAGFGDSDDEAVPLALANGSHPDAGDEEEAEAEADD